MRPARWTIALVFASASALSGCSCNAPNCAVTPALIVDAGIWTEGDPVHVEFIQAMPLFCDEQTKVSAVSPQISDEENAPVPAKGSFSQQDGDLEVRVGVDFEAKDPGWYHAAVKIEPGLATVQFPVLVTHDRSDAGVVQLARTCGRPELTSKGTPLCDGQPVHLDGNSPEFNADSVAVLGDTVWTWSGPDVQRWVDDGTALTLSPVSAARADDGIGALVASADGGEVFTLGVANVNRVAVRNGALVTLSSIPLGRAIRYRYGLATSDTLYAISPQPSSSNTTLGKTTVCAYSLANDLVTFTDQCQEITGLALGIGDGAFWTRDEASVHAWVPNGGELRSAGVALLPPILLADPYLVPGSPPAPVTPLSTSFWLAPRLNADGRGIHYDRYRGSPGFTFYSGSPSAFSEKSGSASRLYPR